MADSVEHNTNEALELYHGTAASRVDSIRANGLLPVKQPPTSKYWSPPAEYQSTLTEIRDIAVGFAQREQLGDRAVIKYRVPTSEVGTYLYSATTSDRCYALRVALPGHMITDVDTDIPYPSARSHSGTHPV